MSVLSKERLTIRGHKGKALLKGSSCRYGDMSYGCQFEEGIEKLSAALDKLAEYEDLEELLREKLSNVAVDIITASKKDFSEWIDRILWTSKRCDELAREVQQYRELEEQGLLLRLPCKVGDDLYWIAGEDEDGNKKPTIRKFESGIKHITITENEIWVNAEDEAPTSLDILGGEYALLTYEEAEEKLRELEGK